METMTYKEKILAEIERLKHYGNIPYDRDMFEGVCLIESFINSLPAEKPSEELEEAANLYATKQGLELKPFARRFFIAGANCQKEQDINKACNWILNNFKCSGYSMPLYYSGVTYSPKDIANDFKKAMGGEQ